MKPKEQEKVEGNWKLRLHTVIYESGTKEGRLFDITLLVLIFVSIIVVMLDSVAPVHEPYGEILYVVEWIFTIIFTIEYILRIVSITKPWKYIFSFYGIIDLLAILPSYLSLLFGGTQYLLILRVLRLLRVFRIFRLRHYLNEMRFLSIALKSSARKISIFMLWVLMLVVILGSVMYIFEGPNNGFGSIPESIYWAIVTITTVGYGDITPVTTAGKFVASFIMLLGYGIIAVPTGIVSTEMALAARKRRPRHDSCPHCSREGHEDDADYCKFCGGKL